MQRSALLLSLSWLFLMFTVGSHAAVISPRVQLAQGEMIGIDDPNSQTWVWLGIPYAKAPIGAWRWQKPVPVAASSQSFQATHAGPICPQYKNDRYLGQEDCLNLSIYRPATQQSLPVLVYIHGGNNQSGKAEEFNPRALAKALNSVIVMVNYRLGALGFNPLAVLKSQDPIQASGNFGLLDQGAALDWVKANIQAFGGQPDRITVSGFSAGGRDVMAMLISPLFKGKFQQAIVFSGGMTTAAVQPSQRVFLAAFAPLVVADGRKPDLQSAMDWLQHGGPKVVDYLRRLTADRIAALMRNAGIRMSVFPHLYRDGVVLPESGFNTDHYNAVPVIMLSGENEFSFFALSDPQFADAYHHGLLLSNSMLLNEYQFVFHYGGKLYSLFNVQRSAQRMYPHYSAPIYATQIRLGTDPDVTGPKMALLGSFHGIFLPLLDRALLEPMLPGVFQKPGVVDMSNHFQRYLAAFLHSGDPNVSGQTRWLSWTPEHQAQGASILILDANQRQAISYMSMKNYDMAMLIEQIKNDHRLPEETKMQLLHQVLNGRWFSDELDQAFQSPSLWP
ncbi:carboxylesterase family protein [Celerinatantimonas sp. YJH-8]|uniref:carboxylesterase family protein n=1 Tax=Celerinatantimonas sp. YJH-8 TaxID=3228714 RepID=UPI0038C6C5BF